MKVKTIIKTGQLFMMAVLLAACASEDVAQDKKKENETEAPKGGVIFAANEPKISAKRLSIGDEDEFAGAKTRTNMKHTPGNGADAYWTSGDFIWVWDKNGNFQQSTHTELHDGGASAEFTLPGSMSDYADGCEVWYTLGGYAIIHPTAVFFSNDKQITAPNDFSIVGGDCGSGKAYATGNPAKFNFRISHKATYLCFLPRCENAALAPNIRLTKIRLTATKCYNNPSYPLCDLYNFDGETIGPNSGYIPYNTMTMEVSDFPLFTTANQEANAVCTIIRPDTYDFKIEYTIKDPTTNVETVVTQTLTNKTFDKGKIYDVTANLIPPPSNLPKYYMWDAEQDYWHGYENEQPFINKGYPGATQGQHYPQSSADPQHRWCNESYPGYGLRDDAKTALFKTCPNANEIVWYALNGDPHWDDNGYSLVTVNGGHLKGVTIGGMWLLKKEAIVRRLTDPSKPNHYPATLTWEKMKEAYGQPGTSAAPIDNPKDMRTGGGNNLLNTSVIRSRPSDTEINDYFFLPALGQYYNGWMLGFGEAGFYWSLSANLWGTPDSYDLYFTPYQIGLFGSSRKTGHLIRTFE